MRSASSSGAADADSSDSAAQTSPSVRAGAVQLLEQDLEQHPQPWLPAQIDVIEAEVRLCVQQCDDDERIVAVVTDEAEERLPLPLQFETMMEGDEHQLKLQLAATIDKKKYKSFLKQAQDVSGLFGFLFFFCWIFF